MMRKCNIIIAIAAAVAFTVAPIADAFARGGGGHGGGGGGGHGMGMGGGGRAMGMGGGWGGRGGGMAFASRGAIGPVGMAGARSMAWHGNHFGHFRHRHFHNRFFFAGFPYAYASYDSCYARVWSAWGWRWTNVCYYGGGYY